MKNRTSLLALSLSLVSIGGAASAQWVETSTRVLRDLTSNAVGEIYGWNAVGLGDVDGDGVTDVAAAAPFFSVGFSSSRGKVYAHSGRDGALLWTREESVTSAVLGYSLEVADWNRDGALDVLAGAPFTAFGKVWVYSGRDGSTLAVLTGGAGSISFGSSIATGGDLDGNGVDDVLVAATNSTELAGSNTGRVLAFNLGSTAPFMTLIGPHAEAEFGLGLAFLGDVSVPPDGRDEFVVGHRLGARNPRFWEGRALVHSHDGTSVGLLYAVDGIGMGYNLSGNLIDAGKDVDGDGAPDFIAGDKFKNHVSVISGRAGTRLATLDGGSEAGQFATGSLIDDVNGDGRADLAIGASLSEAGAMWGGRVYVCSGATGAILATVTSTTARLRIGTDVRPIGDFDGDGRQDLLVGAPGGGQFNPPEGHAFVLSIPRAPANHTLPAKLPVDPRLTDSGGDPGTGPLIGSASEPFNLSLDCTGSSPGPYFFVVHAGSSPQPILTGSGHLWVTGRRLFHASGVHASNVVNVSQAGVILPPSPRLVGLTYTAQGIVGGTPTRLSNALVQTIGR